MRKVFRMAYNLLPFKKQIFSILREVVDLPESIYKHLHFKGVFAVKIEGDKFFLMRHHGFQLENDLFWKGLLGQWERKSLEIWISLCKSSEVVLDVGANTGVYSLVARTMNKEAKVLAFDPVRRVFEKLKANNDLNHYDISCNLMGVSDHVGEAVFFDTESDHTYTVTLNKDMSADKNYHPVSVEIATIDNIIEKNGLDRINLIKIDVETHEPEVIRGFSKIEKYQPIILIEILSDEIGAMVQNELEKHTPEYVYFDIDEKKGMSRVNQIKKSSGGNYLLCNKKKAIELGLMQD